MKGNEKVIETLITLLADELSAVNQYIVHAKMLIERILFLEGLPIVSNLNTLYRRRCGKTI